MTPSTLHHPACHARHGAPCSHACALRARLATGTSTAGLRARLTQARARRIELS